MSATHARCHVYTYALTGDIRVLSLARSVSAEGPSGGVFASDTAYDAETGFSRAVDASNADYAVSTSTTANAETGFARTLEGQGSDGSTSIAITGDRESGFERTVTCFDTAGATVACSAR